MTEKEYFLLNALECVNIKLDSLFLDEKLSDNGYIELRDIRDYIDKKMKELEYIK